MKSPRPTNVFRPERPAPSASREYANSTIARTKAVAWEVASDHVTSFIALPVRQPDSEGEDHPERSGRGTVEVSQRGDRRLRVHSDRGVDACDGERARERQDHESQYRAELEQERRAPAGRRPQQRGAECGEVAYAGHRQHARGRPEDPFVADGDSDDRARRADAGARRKSENADGAAESR